MSDVSWANLTIDSLVGEFGRLMRWRLGMAVAGRQLGFGLRPLSLRAKCVCGLNRTIPHFRQLVLDGDHRVPIALQVVSLAL